ASRSIHSADNPDRGLLHVFADIPTGDSRARVGRSARGSACATMGGLAGLGTATGGLPGDGARPATWPAGPACASAAVAAAAGPTRIEPLDLATRGVAG